MNFVSFSIFLSVITYGVTYSSNYMEYSLIERSDHSKRKDYFQSDILDKNNQHEIVIAVNQKNLDILEELLYNVSTLSLPTYGQYLKYDEIGLLTSNLESTDIVINWLKNNSVRISFVSPFGELIKAEASILKWESIFQTKFYKYDVINNYTGTTNRIQRNCVRATEFSLPNLLSKHIHSIHRLIHLPPRILHYGKIKQRINNEKEKSKFSSLNAVSTYVGPPNLKYAYSISGDGGGLGSQAVYESLNQTFSSLDLEEFQAYFSLENHPVDYYYGNYINGSVCDTSNGPNDCGEASLDVQYILAIANNVPTTFWYDPTSDSDYVEFVAEVSALSSPPLVFSISYGSYEVDVSSSAISLFNTAVMKLGLQGVTVVVASGDDGVTGYAFRDGAISTSYCGYYAQWPASSPYVTSVGATMGRMELTGAVSAETVCSYSLGAGITSGGGFSNSISAPSFQKTAISSYTSKFKATQSIYEPYSTTNRGYPDIAMCGHNYEVAIDGYLNIFDGTSASAPVFAGLVSLVNSNRIAKGLPSLGWITPSIYANNGGFTYDITVGNNKCTASSSCCTIGFSATKGWDPVTGFGSVNYPKFSEYFMNMTSYPSYPPTIQPTLYPSNLPTSFSPTILSSKSTGSTSSPTIMSTSLSSSYSSELPTILTNATFAPTPIQTVSPTVNQTASISTGSTSSPTIMSTSLSSSYSSELPTILTNATFAPTHIQTASPTVNQTASKTPTNLPTDFPSSSPSIISETAPSLSPFASPISLQPINNLPSFTPTLFHSEYPTISPTSTHSLIIPTSSPSLSTSNMPTFGSTSKSTVIPSLVPSAYPTKLPNCSPSVTPSEYPNEQNTGSPTLEPSLSPSLSSIISPSINPTFLTTIPIGAPSLFPSTNLAFKPSSYPITSSNIPSFISSSPTISPSKFNEPTYIPTSDPSKVPTIVPTFEFTPTVSITSTNLPSSSPTSIFSIVNINTQQVLIGVTISSFMNDPNAELAFKTTVAEAISISSNDVSINNVTSTSNNRKLIQISVQYDNSGIIIGYSIHLLIASESKNNTNVKANLIAQTLENNIGNGSFVTLLMKVSNSLNSTSLHNTTGSAITQQPVVSVNYLPYPTNLPTVNPSSFMPSTYTPTIIIPLIQGNQSKSKENQNLIIIIVVVVGFVIISSIFLYLLMLKNKIRNNNNDLSNPKIEVKSNNNESYITHSNIATL